MKRTQLRSKEISEELKPYKITISKKDQVELLEDKHRIILLNQKPAFFYYEEQLVPTLKFLQGNNVLRNIVVDMGAVKFVVNGADIMRPGIVEMDEEIIKNDFVAIVDVNNKKPLAVGLALYDGYKMKGMTSGKVVKNIHYVGDELWKYDAQ